MNRLVDDDTVLLSLPALLRLPVGEKDARQRDQACNNPPSNEFNYVNHGQPRKSEEKKLRPPATKARRRARAALWRDACAGRKRGTGYGDCGAILLRIRSEERRVG